MNKTYYNLLDNYTNTTDKNTSMGAIYDQVKQYIKNYNNDTIFPSTNNNINSKNGEQRCYSKINDYITSIPKENFISYIPASPFTSTAAFINNYARNIVERVNPDNINKWEKKHDDHNKTIRETLNIMEHYRLTKPIATVYKNIMREKEL